MLKGGRTFLRRLITSMFSVQNRNDKALFSPEFNADISRWINFIQISNGTLKFMDLQNIISLQANASLLRGFGYYSGYFFYINWAIDLPAVQNEHINIKETAAVILSAIGWGHLCKYKIVIVLSDNMTTRCILNKGS